MNNDNTRRPGGNRPSPPNRPQPGRPGPPRPPQPPRPEPPRPPQPPRPEPPRPPQPPRPEPPRPPRPPRPPQPPRPMPPRPPVPPIIPPRPLPIQPANRFLQLVMGDYAGNDISELGAVLTYQYEDLVLENMHNEISSQLMQISIDEMRHMHMLGEMIIEMGGNPEYRGGDNRYFAASSLAYPTHIKEMMMVNIQMETAAIQNYLQRVQQAPSTQIAATYEKIIADERRHLEFFRTQLNDLMR